MAKIIEGILYERNRLAGLWDVRTKTCQGVLERTISPAYQWEEVGPAPAYMLVPHDRELDPVLDAEYLADQHEKNLKRAAKRAKLACKWFIIHSGFNEVLTLTYRDNQQDESLAKTHHKEWVRRMKRALGGKFCYCTGFEPQERGAWHMHVATHKLPKHAVYKGVKIEAWKLGTMIWRDVVGRTAEGKDGGLCFVGGKPAKWGRRARRNMGLYKLANYVSKYITKHYDLMPESLNRYSRSNGQPMLERHCMRVAAQDIGELIALCFEQPGGSVVVSHRLNVAGEFWLLASEGPPTVSWLQ